MSGSDRLWLCGGGDEATPTELDGLLTGLLTALRQPGSPDELAGEEAVVAAMQAALGPPPSLRSVDNGSGRLVRRITVAKGVALAGVVAFGVAAAAATTGVVDLGRMPGWGHDPPRHEPAPARPGRVDETEDTPSSLDEVQIPGDDGGPDGGPDAVPAPTSSSTTTGPPNTTPAGDPEGSEGPDPADSGPPPSTVPPEPEPEPEPPMTLPPPASERGGPPGRSDPPPCRPGPAATAPIGDASSAPPPCDS